ncbi:MAG: hypothetical protein ACRDRK_06375 [Pseudonocardia sp.]
MIEIVDLDRAEADLRAGELACPACGGVLRRWDTAGRGGSVITAAQRQGQWNHGHAHCQCRFPDGYALANRVTHSRNVYLAERDVLPALGDWLMLMFAPHRLTETIEAMQDCQPADTDEGVATILLGSSTSATAGSSGIGKPWTPGRT